MMKAVYHYCINNGRKLGGRKLKKSTDFLWITDDIFFF